MQSQSLPLNRDLSPVYILSLIIALLMAGASLAGIFFQNRFYPGEELRRTFLPNDVVNLLIGLPGLFAAAVLTRRGRWIGLLIWPGALFYVTYTYIAYTVGTGNLFLRFFYAALTVLSAGAIWGLFAGMDRAAIHRRLIGNVPVRSTGWILLGLGTLFFLRSLWQISSGQEVLPRTELAVLVSDALITPFWIGGGILLLRKQALGYCSGLGLLYQASLLFVALLVFFLLKPVISGEPFPAIDFFVVLAMGMVCFVPFYRFARGVLRSLFGIRPL